MPVTRTPADIMCLAVYTLAGGKVLRGFMVATIADQLGINIRAGGRDGRCRRRGR